MALIQLFVTWLGKSAGRLANAVFGWAVAALFGRQSSHQQTLLSIVVGMAALWPLLALGILFPRAATFLIAFVPVTKELSSGVIRVVWIVLALAVPVIVGIVIARKSPDAQRERPVKRFLRGFPVTLGLAAAFVISFVTVPILRIASARRGWSDEHLPLITTGHETKEAAATIDKIVRGFGATRAEPPWWMKAPAAILRTMGGATLGGMMPEEAFYWSGPELRVALYPSDVVVRGPKRKAAWTHGWIDEAFGRGPGLETFDPEAQAIERQVHRAWRVLEREPRAHADSTVLTHRAREMLRDLTKLDVSYDEWQILYRKVAQFTRALESKPPLLQWAIKEE